MDSQNMRNDQILSSFPWELRKNIQELLSSGSVGLSPKPFKISLGHKLYKPENGSSYMDRFQLDLPYAGVNLQWEVSFNAQDSYYAPDFEFLSDNFLGDPEIDILTNNVPSLANWDLDNSKSLISTIKELLSLYKHYQMEKLTSERKFSNHYKDYKMLLEKTKYNEDDIEVYIDGNDSVHILLVMRTDSKLLPTYMQPLMYTSEEDRYLNPGEDAALLKVTYLSNRITANLTLSPRLEQHLGNPSGLHIPSFRKELGLVEYVINIETVLQDRVNEIEKFFKLRNDLITSLLTVQADTIVDYDNVHYNHANLLLVVDDFYCLVNIVMDEKFPREKPQILLRSVYHEQTGKPRKHCMESYPYSPRWSGNEMVCRILNTLASEIPKFKAMCLKEPAF